MGEIKKRAAENRRKELEGTLDFFLAHVKQHASVMPVFPVNMPDAPRNGKSAVAQDLAASSRQATQAMMFVVVENRNNEGRFATAAGQADKGNLPIVDEGTSTGLIATAAAAFGEAHVDSEPEDKPMVVVDRKGKAKATDDIAPRATRQKTMHEMLATSSPCNLTGPDIPSGLVDTSMYYVMTEDHVMQPLIEEAGAAGEGSHAKYIAKYTPIGNKRLTLPGVEGSPDPTPNPLAVVHPDAYLSPELDYGYSPFELELNQFQYPDHVCLGFYDNVEYLCCITSLGCVWYESSHPTPLKLDGNKIKYQFSLKGEMHYNGMEAWVRGFNEREIKMMEMVGLPVWRGFVSPDVPLHFENILDLEGAAVLRMLLSSRSIGYQLRLCRLIMMPISMMRGWCLYVFDMHLKKLNVLDPVFT
ncbi:uncharacterized protein [Aegilops tauschii subsp. strangulata]|uniref:uncharacterized protein n=1 Tax=Aegilops tauschii subsp. strangulata TaxID=200361 RepID=UPI001E1CA301|nr:uncharacterized protein LOC120965893 [Aegilops tauschii subsp. strangulata]